MAEDIQILDCTLRDGAYLVDKKFGNETIKGIIDGLMKANIDVIEIGFLQNEGQGDGKTVFLNQDDAQQFIPEDKQGKIFTVLADYSRYSVENLSTNTERTFDAVRECFFKHERFEAIENCKKIKKKGYRVFIQPVDILGYSDAEILELIALVNEVEPYAFSIVDTFGSMYLDDLERLFSLIHHNLVETSAIGFHSHNNLQMSSALSQRFIELCGNKRRGIIDATVSGMGRGAGNTPTELVADYMARRCGGNYEIDAILDIIDSYMENIRTKCQWGYSTDYFIAGSYGAHVNNINYLREKTSILSKDMRFIMNKLSVEQRKRYDYDLLEKEYLDYLKSDIDDTADFMKLKENLEGKDIVILAPGKSVEIQKETIQKYIDDNHAEVIGINFIHETIQTDYVYISNKKRYETIKKQKTFWEKEKIFGSNLKTESDEKTYVVSIIDLIKCGWIHFDNSALMLLRLLDKINVRSIGIAGLDGYSLSNKADNYYKERLEMASAYDNPIELNRELTSMLEDYQETRKNRDIAIHFITESRFEGIF